MIVKVDLNFDCNDLKSNDLFVGRRNTGYELGVCSYVTTSDLAPYIISSDTEKYKAIYTYYTWECLKVLEIVREVTKEEYENLLIPR